MPLVPLADIVAATQSTSTPAQLDAIFERLANAIDAKLGDAELGTQTRIDHQNLAQPFAEWNLVLTRPVLGLTDFEAGVGAAPRSVLPFKYPFGLPPLHIVGMQCLFVDPTGGGVSCQLWHIPNGFTVARPVSPVVDCPVEKTVYQSLPFDVAVVGGDILQVRWDTSSGDSPDPASCTLRCQTRLVHGP